MTIFSNSLESNMFMRSEQLKIGVCLIQHICFNGL